MYEAFWAYVTTINNSVFFACPWTGAHEEIDYSAKLKFSDDEGEDEGDEDASEGTNATR